MTGKWTITMECTVCYKTHHLHTDWNTHEIYDAIDDVEFEKTLHCDRCGVDTKHKFLCIGISGETVPK